MRQKDNASMFGVTKQGAAWIVPRDGLGRRQGSMLSWAAFLLSAHDEMVVDGGTSASPLRSGRGG